MDTAIGQAIMECEQLALPQIHELPTGREKRERNGDSSGHLMDVGEKIGGARKDLWRLHGLSVQDLDSMS